MAVTVTPTPLLSRTTPGYTWISEIAKGGLGTVSLVLRRDGRFQRLYALKRLHPHLREDPEVRTMFMEEARVAGLLRHPNIVGVLDVGEDDDGPFLVMEYVDGLSLATAVKILGRRGELFPISIVVDVIRQVADGLRSAHELVADDGTPSPIVHRDISPQNVLLGFDGIARLTDFGIAKAIGGDGQTTTHALKGKYGYMSPEQLRFSRLDARADLFALGVVMWEMAAGKRLFPGRDLEVTANRILNDPPPDLLAERGDAPPELERILFGLLAKDRDHRTTSAATVVAELTELGRTVEPEADEPDLRAFLASRFADLRDETAAERAIAVRRASEQVAESSFLPSVPTRKRAKPRSTVAIAGAVLLGVLIGAGVLFAAQALTESEPAQPAAESEPLPASPESGARTEAALERPSAAPEEPTAPAVVEAEVEPDDPTAEAIEEAPPSERTPRARTKRRATRRPRQTSARDDMTAGMQPLSDWWE
jgi:serine/threonine-protein kinase